MTTTKKRMAKLSDTFLLLITDTRNHGRVGILPLNVEHMVQLVSVAVTAAAILVAISYALFNH